MTDNYDIIIIGAGIAGLYCGIRLAEAGRSVCIIDRKKEIGLPVRCGEATGNRKELSRFIDIDESWIARDFHGLAVHFNGKKSLAKDIPECGVMLYRDRFERALSEKAREKGAQIRLNTNAEGLMYNQEDCNGVVLDSGEEIVGTVIIGADGVESKIGRLAGITEVLALRDAFSSLQYRIESDFCNDEYLHFFIGSLVIPGGYIWVFPKSDSEINIGAGLYRGNTGLHGVRHLLDRFIAEQIPRAQKRNLITGCVPLAVCPAILAKDNVVVVGDAARQVNPLTAGGIMNALEAADLAVGAILNNKPAVDTGRINREYSRVWRKTQRRYQKMFYLCKEMFLDCSDKDINLLLQKVEKFYTKADRSTPFTFPLITFLRIAILFLPKMIKHLRVLFR